MPRLSIDISDEQHRMIKRFLIEKPGGISSTKELGIVAITEFIEKHHEHTALDTAIEALRSVDFTHLLEIEQSLEDVIQKGRRRNIKW